MSNKLVKETKTPEIKESGAGFVVALVCVVLICVIGVVFATQKRENEPITNPEAIAFSFNQETGEVEAENLGEDFTWDGTWHANDQVMDAIELQEEMGEEEFWEVFGDEKD